MTKKYKILGSKSLPDSEMEIECEIEAESVVCHRTKAISKIQKDLSLPGFRPGHVPEAMLVKQVGDFAIYNEMAEMAINESFPEIIGEAKANFITMPQIQITKIADKNPIQFKISGPVMPEIKLADYKIIAKKENSKPSEATEPTEKELEETIEEIRKNFALKNKKIKNNDGAVKNDEINKNSEPKTTESSKKKDTEEKTDLPAQSESTDWPEVNEEWVKKLGNFKDVEDFKNKIREGIQKEKEFKAKDKKRMAIIEKIIADSKVSIPKILVESELRKMQAQFEDDITRAGLKVDDYLKHLKKTIDDLKKEWIADAEKRAKVQLIITKIALEEKIEADPEQIKKEVENLLKTYKDATEERTRAYVEMMLINEKVFEWLENQK